MNIVHRDVNPQNVFVTYTGNVKVVDFGIAKTSDRINKTQSGSVRGKVRYMSPEQVLLEPVDHRADIFSVGVMLFELTTQRRLFRGESDYEILKGIVENPVLKPSHVVADYPPDLEQIVMRALHRDKRHRYATAEQLQRDLEEFVRSHQLALTTEDMTYFMRSLFGQATRRHAVGTGSPPSAENFNRTTVREADMEKLAAMHHPQEVMLSDTAKTSRPIRFHSFYVSTRSRRHTCRSSGRTECNDTSATSDSHSASMPFSKDFGELQVATSPPCELFINGKSYGQTPLSGVKLAPATHNMRLVNKKYEIDNSYRVNVSANSVTDKQYKFDVTGK